MVGYNLKKVPLRDNDIRDIRGEKLIDSRLLHIKAWI